VKHRIQLVMLDLDGTLYWKGQMIPGALEAVQGLRDAGYRTAFLTNTDSVPPEAVQERLVKRGIEVRLDEIISPPVAVQRYLDSHPGMVSHFLVSESLKPMFAEYPQSDQQADVVVVGDMGGKVTYRDLNTAFRLLHRGAELLALNKGRTIDKKDGPHLDTGPFVALLEFASRKTARVMGKPAVEYMESALQQFHVQAEECVMVGDDLEIDIQGAHNIGCRGVLVKTGSFHPDTLEASTLKPDAVIDSVASILTWLQEQQS